MASDPFLLDLSPGVEGGQVRLWVCWQEIGMLTLHPPPTRRLPHRADPGGAGVSLKCRRRHAWSQRGLEQGTSGCTVPHMVHALAGLEQPRSSKEQL